MELIPRVFWAWVENVFVKQHAQCLGDWHVVNPGCSSLAHWLFCHWSHCRWNQVEFGIGVDHSPALCVKSDFFVKKRIRYLELILRYSNQGCCLDLIVTWVSGLWIPRGQQWKLLDQIVAWNAGRPLDPAQVPATKSLRPRIPLVLWVLNAVVESEEMETIPWLRSLKESESPWVTTVSPQWLCAAHDLLNFWPGTYVSVCHLKMG